MDDQRSYLLEIVQRLNLGKALQGSYLEHNRVPQNVMFAVMDTRCFNGIKSEAKYVAIAITLPLLGAAPGRGPKGYS